MKTMKHSRYALLALAATLASTTAHAAGADLWREQVARAPQLSVTLAPRSGDAVRSGTSWLWQVQLPSAPTPTLYGARTTRTQITLAGAPWREQVANAQQDRRGHVARSRSAARAR